MTFRTKLFAFLLGAVLACGVYEILVHTQTTHADVRPPALLNPWQIKPQALPTTLTNICNMGTTAPPCGRDVYACMGDVNQDPSATVLTVTIEDFQVPPQTYWNQVPLTGASASAGGGYKLFDSPGDQACRWFPGGMQVSASGTGGHIYMSGKSN